jgi:hypothetical protein
VATLAEGATHLSPPTIPRVQKVNSIRNIMSLSATILKAGIATNDLHAVGVAVEASCSLA